MNNNNKIEMGVIGFGQMGQFIAKHLRNDFKVFVNDEIDKSEEAREIGVEFAKLEIAASKQIVILAVPIPKMPQIVESISVHIRNDALLADVCSVKEYPLEIMSKIKCSDIIGMHPLFGPQSGKHSIKGFTIILCPLRTTKLEKVKAYLQKLGLNVIVTTAEEHDRKTAKTGHLAHFIARGLDQNESSLSEPSYQKLVELLDLVKDDSSEMFYGIQSFNRFCSEERKKIIFRLAEIDKKIDKNNFT